MFGAAAVGSTPAAGPANRPQGGLPMGAQQGEGDKTHTNKWRVEGSLFYEDESAANFGGIVGRDPGSDTKKRKA
jgi:hypothetical protein